MLICQHWLENQPKEGMGLFRVGTSMYTQEAQLEISLSTPLQTYFRSKTHYVNKLWIKVFGRQHKMQEVMGQSPLLRLSITRQIVNKARRPSARSRIMLMLMFSLCKKQGLCDSPCKIKSKCLHISYCFICL